MNRSRYIPRDYEKDSEFVNSLNDHIAALREFGGEIYIGADRAPIDKDGNVLPRHERGAGFLTIGYVLGYTEKTRIRNVAEEPDEPFASGPAPAYEPDSPNGAPPEPDHEQRPVEQEA